MYQIPQAIKTITKLKSKLKVLLKDMKAIDEQLSDLYTFERTLREKSEIIEGKRVLNEEETIQIQHTEAEISKCFFQLDGSASVSNDDRLIQFRS